MHTNSTWNFTKSLSNMGGNYIFSHSSASVVSVLYMFTFSHSTVAIGPNMFPRAETASQCLLFARGVHGLLNFQKFYIHRKLPHVAALLVLLFRVQCPVLMNWSPVSLAHFAAQPVSYTFWQIPIQGSIDLFLKEKKNEKR